jgi:hypothetical protein
MQYLRAGEATFIPLETHTRLAVEMDLGTFISRVCPGVVGLARMIPHGHRRDGRLAMSGAEPRHDALGHRTQALPGLPNEREGRPVHGVRVLCQHGQHSTAQRVGSLGALGQLSVERHHQGTGRGVRNCPQRRDDGRYPRRHPGARQADHPVADEGSPSRVTGAQDDERRVGLEPCDLIRREQPRIAARRRP